MRAEEFVKIIKIAKCQQCPYYQIYPGYTSCYCKKHYRYLQKRPKRIPHWCTLEDAKEEIEQAKHKAIQEVKEQVKHE